MVDEIVKTAKQVGVAKAVNVFCDVVHKMMDNVETENEIKLLDDLFYSFIKAKNELLDKIEKGE